MITVSLTEILNFSNDEKKYNLFILALTFSLYSVAQISIDKQPISSQQVLLSDLPTVNITPPNLEALALEDNENAIKGKPYRYATFIDCIDPSKDGRWEVVSPNVSVWRLKIKSHGAHALALSFNAFWIPSNGELFIYNSDKSKILGAYTNKNNHPSGIFANELIEGDELILEYAKKRSH